MSVSYNGYRYIDTHQIINLLEIFYYVERSSYEQQQLTYGNEEWLYLYCRYTHFILNTHDKNLLVDILL